jgi:uncharacterized repeat protein (TIGR01451 family)
MRRNYCLLSLFFIITSFPLRSFEQQPGIKWINYYVNSLKNGDYLVYLVRFQNTGTDTAFSVTVRDTLDAKLDWNTIQMIGASHAYDLNITSGNILS